MAWLGLTWTGWWDKRTRKTAPFEDEVGPTRSFSLFLLPSLVFPCKPHGEDRERVRRRGTNGSEIIHVPHDKSIHVKGRKMLHVGEGIFYLNCSLDHKSNTAQSVALKSKSSPAAIADSSGFVAVGGCCRSRLKMQESGRLGDRALIWRTWNWIISKTNPFSWTCTE